ncbi:MAG: ParB/RepB/Spo0J family partition protein [Fibromonadaceae bacterium]|jgi:ParB/RepB/Spo0J family partition protein|nr:ParB/RepB/Spo0J family partition protein [Fibromonadaceae bacterium]
MAKKQQNSKALSKKASKAFKKAAAETQTNNLSAAAKRETRRLPISEICTDPQNPRRRAITPENDPGLQDLADSIAKFGDVLEPLIVRLRTEEEREGDGFFPDCPYMLISGHRRKAAAKLAGIETLHCVVWENISPAEAFEMQLVENLHRADLLPTEEALAYQRMISELHYTYKEISLRVGRSDKHILRYLRLQMLPEELKAKIDSGECSIQKALFLCSLPEGIVEKILDGYDYLLGSSMTYNSFKDALFRTFIKDLDGDLPFKLDGKYGSLPKCTECPHKGSHPELFAEYAEDDKDKCPLKQCFREKEAIAEEQREKAKAKAQAKKGNAREDEDNANDDDDDNEGSSGNDYWDQHKAVRQARAAWYLDKLIAIRGLNVFDLFVECMENDDFLDDDWDDLYKQHTSKTSAELQQSGTPEEILKAKLISDFCNKASDYDEDEMVKWLGCEECPDEVLNRARVAAL